MATINGTFNSLIAGTLSGTVATPGATGPAGPAGPTGPTGAPGAPGVGVPAGGTTGQVLAKVDGVNYNTHWIDQSAPDFISSVSSPLAVTSGNLTINLSAYATQSFVTSQGYITSAALVPYLTKADNLGSLTNFGTARDNLGLGTLSNPTFAGATLQGSGANVAQLTPTSISLTHATSGSFVIQPSSGITFPDTSIQTTAFVAGSSLPTGGTVGQVLTKNSGSNFDASFQTLIPGDRYLTTSTTSLTINNNNKTLTVGTGLSYTSQQDVVIAYDAANHMHAQVLTYNSGTGVMTVDVRSHSGSGTFTFWTVNVGGTVPEASVSWGSITGTLGNQTDLATALNAKLEVSTAASTYFTIASAAGKANLASPTFTGTVTIPAGASISGYLTTASAASTYQTQSGMSDYLAKAGNLSGLASTSSARSNLGLGSIAVVNDAPSDGTTYGRKDGAWVAAGSGGGKSVKQVTSASYTVLPSDFGNVVVMSSTSNGKIFLPEAPLGTQVDFISIVQASKQFDGASFNVGLQTPDAKVRINSSHVVITATCYLTPFGFSNWVLNNSYDMTTGWPPYGDTYFQGCVEASGNDANDTFWSGLWTYLYQITNGLGGFITVDSGDNRDGCYYPSGYCISLNQYTNNDSGLLDSDGNPMYYRTWDFASFSDGSGSSYLSSTGRPYGTVISDYYNTSSGTAYFISDGGAGFIIQYV
jgi:hypothetical protein